MSKLPVFLLLLLLIVSCSMRDKGTTDNNGLPPIDSLFIRYSEERLPLYPIEATMAGDDRFNAYLPNTISESFRSRLRDFYSRYKNELMQYDRSSLGKSERISCDILAWECDINLEDLSFPKHLIPINQFDCLPLMIGQFAGGSSAQPFHTVQDYDNWLERLDAYTVWCDTAIANMRRGMATGYVLPKALARKVMAQMAEFDHGPVEQHLFFSPVKKMPADFSKADRARLKSEYAAMIENKIIPVYKRLRIFLEKDYLPVCSNQAGISALPDGAALYRHQIRLHTTTNLTANEVFALGEKEVARITAEMEKVKSRVGFKGDLKAFFELVRNKKELKPYRKAEEVIGHFIDIHNTIKPQIEALFDLKPKTPFELRRTEAFREKTASAEYVQGSLDGSRPGIFYVPVPDARQYNIYSDEGLFLHEAIPGHHYQISIQQENAALPTFRRLLWYSAYGEGWALYAESLGSELGLYKDPYQYFGMLSAEMHRAIRLVVDAGMHAKGWTREQAIQYSLDHEADSESSVVAEIERYMAWPGQALSYKIGQLKILELRAKTEKREGEKFDIKAFHKKMLEEGCVPLTVLEGILGF